MAGQKALKFKNRLVPKQPGELARLRVLSGQDSGAVFVVLDSRVTIGRDNNNDIVLTDLKASRNHAQISVQGGFAEIKDIGSSHGIVVNGAVLKTSNIRSGDKLGVGETVFEFTGGTYPKQSESFLEKNKKLLMIFAGLMLLATLLPEVEKKRMAKRAYQEPNEVAAERGLSSINPPLIDENTKKAADLHFKEGFREFRAKNYARARLAFETALQIYPAHSMAHVYLETTKKTMEDEAKALIGNAQRDEEALRYSQALTKYNAVKRLYGREPSSDQFKEASMRVEELDKKIKEMK